ncbi:MAG: SIMPL domain-containing protein, partial [Thermoleophilia bacterium]|nr:SIMPL domain-containing protein [Thermoleophilia bacterium]
MMAGHTERDRAAAPGSKTITVTGAATVSVAPDEAMLTFVVESDGVEPGTSMAANAIGVGSLLTRLSAEGVDVAATQTANVSVYPIRTYDPKTGQESLTGYRSQNTVVVRLRGADMTAAAGKLLSAGLEA